MYYSRVWASGLRPTKATTAAAGSSQGRHLRSGTQEDVRPCRESGGERGGRGPIHCTSARNRQVSARLVVSTVAAPRPVVEGSDASEMEARQSPSQRLCRRPGQMGNQVSFRRAHRVPWCPQRDSNPCYRLERPATGVDSADPCVLRWPERVLHRLPPATKDRGSSHAPLHEWGGPARPSGGPVCGRSRGRRCRVILVPCVERHQIRPGCPRQPAVSSTRHCRFLQVSRDGGRRTYTLRVDSWRGVPEARSNRRRGGGAGDLSFPRQAAG